MFSTVREKTKERNLIIGNQETSHPLPQPSVTMWDSYNRLHDENCETRYRSDSRNSLLRLVNYQPPLHKALVSGDWSLSVLDKIPHT